jgi:hypothetical protein
VALRDVILRIVPGSWRDGMIADSKAWMATCRTCKTSTSIWDLGGLRWKGWGDRVTTTPCRICGGYRRHDLHRSEG